MASEIDKRLRQKADDLTTRIRNAQSMYEAGTPADDAAIRLTVNALRAERADILSQLEARKAARRNE